MEANKKPRISIKHTLAIIYAAILILAVALLVIILFRKGPGVPQNKTTGSAQKSPLTAGGAPVPTQWQAKARRLGYYCPSWSAGPGEAASNICIPLDK